MACSAGETVNLAEIKSPGCIKHLWMTTSCRRLQPPAASSPQDVLGWRGNPAAYPVSVGRLFGLGHAQPQYISSLPIQVAYLGMNCYFHAGAAGAKITITNDSDQDSFIYF